MDFPIKNGDFPLLCSPEGSIIVSVALSVSIQNPPRLGGRNSGSRCWGCHIPEPAGRAITLGALVHSAQRFLTDRCCKGMLGNVRETGINLQLWVSSFFFSSLSLRVPLHVRRKPCLGCETKMVRPLSTQVLRALREGERTEKVVEDFGNQVSRSTAGWSGPKGTFIDHMISYDYKVVPATGLSTKFLST